MPRLLLLAVLSLDGAWRTDAVSSRVLRRLAEAAGKPAGPLWTDLPGRRRLPAALRRVPTARLLAQALASRGREAFVALGTPAFHAALLAAVPPGGLEFLVLQRPEIFLGPGRATLADSFLPASGSRVGFRLVSARAVAEGLLCRYRSLSPRRNLIPR